MTRHRPLVSSAALLAPSHRSPTAARSSRSITLSLAVAAAAAALLSACGLLEDQRADDPPTVTAPLTGAYDVTSHFEVPATVAAPGPLGDALRLVHGLATDPGAALLDLAEAAGVPALAELRLVLPDALESQLTGWMNEALSTATVGGTSPRDRLGELDALIRSVLLRWELRSTLDLPVAGAGTHAPVALAFGSPAGPVVVPLDATAPVTAGVDVTATLAWPDGPTGPAHVTVGDHAMGVPFGRYALAGLEAVLAAETGHADLRAFLTDAVGCAAVAAEVAGQCAGPLCVGHQGELLAICTGAVDEAAARLEAEVLDLDFKAIHFEQGTAAATGAPTPTVPVPTGLAGGAWTATIDLGNGPEAASATFSATR